MSVCTLADSERDAGGSDFDRSLITEHLGKSLLEDLKSLNTHKVYFICQLLRYASKHSLLADTSV